MEKNTASARKPLTARAPYLQLVKGDSAPIKTCACGREIDGDHPTCGQCNLIRTAELRHQPLYGCVICGADTPFLYCWDCNRKPEEEKSSARMTFFAQNPDDPRSRRRPLATRRENPPAKDEAPKSSSKPVAESKPSEKTEPTNAIVLTECDGWDELRFRLAAEASVERPIVVLKKDGSVAKTVLMNEDGTLIEYRELTVNEAIPVKLIANEIEEEEERIRHAEDVQRQMDEARKAREAETARVAALRAPLLKTLAELGREGLKMMGVLVLNHPRIDVGGDKYEDPHFTVRVKDDTARPDGYREFDLFDKEAEKELKEARAAHAKDLEEAAKARREAEAAARRAKHAPKANEPRPGHSSGDSGNGKHGKGGRNGKGGKSGDSNKNGKGKK